MDFRLGHIGLLTERVRETVDFYRDRLGLLVVREIRQPGITHIVFLADRSSSNFLIEVHGPPWFDPEEERFVEDHGPAALDHLHFWVPDVLEAYASLRSWGLRSRLEPMEFMGGWEAALYDPLGAEIWLRAEGEDRQLTSLAEARAKGTREPACLAGVLHHIGLLTAEPRAAVDFYTGMLGLQAVTHARVAGQAEATFLMDHTGCPTYLQILGPPHLPHEEEFLKTHGAGFNHLHFLVQELDAAFLQLTDHGAWVNYPPEWGHAERVAGLFDPQGIDVQLLAPLPRKAGRRPG
jgi:catechol 2,3-dioxygenase-like lactoylglutathione lyase family enzyme